MGAVQVFVGRRSVGLDRLPTIACRALRMLLAREARHHYDPLPESSRSVQAHSIDPWPDLIRRA
jgi:hypothetical protein